jgi:hypothetical protein
MTVTNVNASEGSIWPSITGAMIAPGYHLGCFSRNRPGSARWAAWSLTALAGKLRARYRGPGRERSRTMQWANIKHIFTTTKLFNQLFYILLASSWHFLRLIGDCFLILGVTFLH